MAELRQEETQQELFGEFHPEAKRTNRFPSIQKTQKPILLSTSLEQIILVGILLILGGCCVFFLGILRGRSLREVHTVRQSGAAVLPLNSQAEAAMQVRASRPESLDLNKPYSIQCATYKKKEIAEREVAALKKSGYFAYIIVSGDYFEVCVGQYASKEEAKRKLKDFSSKYKDCFLRRR